MSLRKKVDKNCLAFRELPGDALTDNVSKFVVEELQNFDSLHCFFNPIRICLHMFIFQDLMSGIHHILILSNRFLYAGDCSYDS